MANKNSYYQEPKVGNPTVFIIVLAFFLLSAGLIIYGLLNPKKEDEEVVQKQEVAVNENEESVPLEDYFKGDFGSNTTIRNDAYLKDDPFKDSCASTAGDNKPAYKSNTVCLR